MSIEVVVPDGCAPGDHFLVETEDGGQFSVVVPPDGFSGMSLVVDLPDAVSDRFSARSGELPLCVDVVVPDGCYPGDQFFVEHEGTQFCVDVPDGCGPGSSMQVEVPLASDAAGPSESRAVVAAENAAAKAAADEVRSKQTRPASITVDGGPQEEKPKGKLTMSLALVGGLSLNLALTAAAQFVVGEQVEVCRTDGTWSLAVVREFEEYGFTYTVELEDGRIKYMVEEEDLRKPLF